MNEDILLCRKCGIKGQVFLPPKKIIKNEKITIKVMVTCGECGETWTVPIDEMKGE